jgi:hypothetical protein
MNSEPTKPSFFGRFVIVAAAIMLLGAGWASVMRPPAADASYPTTPFADASAGSPSDSSAGEPRECEPAKGVDSKCIYE